MALMKSNKFMACLALATVCAVLVIASGLWFASAEGEECARLQRWPVVILGVAILMVALAGFIGAYWDNGLARFLLKAYFYGMLGAVVVLTVFLLIGYAVTRGSGAYPVLGRAYKEYRLDGFSMWLRGYVSDSPARWEGIMSCLAESDTCKELARQGSFVTADQFYSSNLITPLQSGCCKPPSACGFGYVGPTVWTNPTSAPVQDCGLWSNDPAQLCYECESCRAGLLAAMRTQWHKTSIALLIATLVLFFALIAGWKVYKNDSWGRRKC
uniref:Uncharacterized protein n=1 Tax=Avena sativa TaxID=4498 RepID=A0ACD5YP70_AVESA